MFVGEMENVGFFSVKGPHPVFSHQNTKKNTQMQHPRMQGYDFQMSQNSSLFFF